MVPTLRPKAIPVVSEEMAKIGQYVLISTLASAPKLQSVLPVPKGDMFVSRQDVSKLILSKRDMQTKSTRSD